ncbi:hypothetical protein D3C73_1286930 [compost metagenome]
MPFAWAEISLSFVIVYSARTTTFSKTKISSKSVVTSKNLNSLSDACSALLNPAAAKVSRISLRWRRCKLRRAFSSGLNFLAFALAFGLGLVVAIIIVAPQLIDFFLVLFPLFGYLSHLFIRLGSTHRLPEWAHWQLASFQLIEPCASNF